MPNDPRLAGINRRQETFDRIVRCKLQPLRAERASKRPGKLHPVDLGICLPRTPPHLIGHRAALGRGDHRLASHEVDQNGTGFICGPQAWRTDLMQLQEPGPRSGRNRCWPLPKQDLPAVDERRQQQLIVQPQAGQRRGFSHWRERCCSYQAVQCRP